MITGICLMALIALWIAFTIWLLVDIHVTKDELKCSQECEKRWQQRWEESKIQTKRYATACDISNKMYDKALCKHADHQLKYHKALEVSISRKDAIQNIKSICDKLLEVAEPKPETETEATNDPDLHPDC